MSFLAKWGDTILIWGSVAIWFFSPCYKHWESLLLPNPLLNVKTAGAWLECAEHVLELLPCGGEAWHGITHPLDWRKKKGHLGRGHTTREETSWLPLKLTWHSQTSSFIDLLKTYSLHFQQFNSSAYSAELFLEDFLCYLTYISFWMHSFILLQFCLFSHVIISIFLCQISS